MNSRTAKLLRRVAARRAKGLGTVGVPILGALKKAWNATPRPVRHEVRAAMNREVLVEELER